MLFMRNRTGVVFPRNEGLLSDPTLDFSICDLQGNDLPNRETVAEVPKVIQTKKFTKKGK